MNIEKAKSQLSEYGYSLKILTKRGDTEDSARAVLKTMRSMGPDYFQ